MGGAEKAEELWGREAGGAIWGEEQEEGEEALLTAAPLGPSAMGMISV